MSDALAERMLAANFVEPQKNGNGQNWFGRIRNGCTGVGTPADLSAVSSGPSPPIVTVGSTPSPGSSRVHASIVRDVLPRSRLLVERTTRIRYAAVGAAPAGSLARRERPP